MQQVYNSVNGVKPGRLGMESGRSPNIYVLGDLSQISDVID